MIHACAHSVKDGHRLFGAALGAFLGLLSTSLPAHADIPPPDYDFLWANISDRNNAAYPGPGGNAGRGSVSYAYRISKLEITTQQWADFLSMGLRQGVNLDTYALRPSFWGATRSGNQYIATEPMRPVIGLNWRAGAYYCNWLTNGKQESWTSCLTGAYDSSTFHGGVGQKFSDQLTHSPGAKFWIPTLDEYLKASHYDPNGNGPGQGRWWAYPYKSDSPPIPGAPGVGQTSGGWEPGGFEELAVNLGAYTNYTSAYGLWDLSGGAREWIEEPLLYDVGEYRRRGQMGSYAGDRGYLDADRVQVLLSDYPASDGFYGFRIASQIPAPSVTVAFVGISGFLFRRRKLREGPLLGVLCGGAFLASAGSARADIPPDYDFQWSNITDLNNPAYPGGPPFNTNAGRGSVSYKYRISRLEITTSQWADFVNMALRQGVNITSAPDIKPAFWGASPAGNQFTVTNPLQPVIGLNWRAGAYYCNWLNNGKQESWSSCQSGAYDASTFGDLADGTYTDQLTHSPGAKFWIPAYDEWLKAAHYDPSHDGPGQGGWWSYPYQSESAPVPGKPGEGTTTAGLQLPNFAEFQIPLGAYAGAVSAYGLWDLSGGATEWTEEPTGQWNNGYIGRRADGSYAGASSGTLVDHIQQRDSGRPSYDGFLGFRIAGQIPSPPGAAVMLVGIAGFALHRKR